MAVYREHGPDKDNINVEHIPIELSSALCFFVKHGGKVSAKVRQETHRASHLEQGGVVVPITVHCAISTQKAQFLTRLKQLINTGWILAILTKASTTTKERECVSHNNRNVNIAIYFQFCFVVQHVHRS